MGTLSEDLSRCGAPPARRLGLGPAQEHAHSRQECKPSPNLAPWLLRLCMRCPPFCPLTHSLPIITSGTLLPCSSHLSLSSSQRGLFADPGTRQMFPAQGLCTRGSLYRRDFFFKELCDFISLLLLFIMAFIYFFKRILH